MDSAQANKEGASGSLLVVNMRGMVNTRAPVLRALTQLHLTHRFNATIVPDTEMFEGVLKSAKEHVAWCRADVGTVEKLLHDRGENLNGGRLRESGLAKGSPFSSLSDLAQAIESGKVKLGSALGVKAFFRLSPPRGGFKRSSRRQYSEGGILGPNKELPILLNAML